MMPLKQTVFLALLACFLSLPRPTHAATYHDFLRLNKIYVLYTAPIVPHTDAKGVFWVGLNPFAALLGAKVQPTASPQSVTVTCRGHTLTLTAGAKQAVLDGKAFPMQAAAKTITTHREFVVPATTLTRAFGFPTQWNQKYRVLTIADRGLYDQATVEDWIGRIEQFEGPPRGYPQRVRAFEGPPYPVPPVVPIAVIEKNKRLVLRLRNVSRNNFPYMFLDVLVNGSQGEQLAAAGIPYPTSYPQPPASRLIKAGETLDFGASYKDNEMSIADVVTSQPHSIPNAPVGYVTSTTTRHKVGFVAVWVVPFVP